MKTDGQWEFKSGKADNHLYSYAGQPTYYSVAKFELYLRRRPQYVVMNVIMPCFLMTILSAMIFFIPPAAGEKITFNISMLLAFTVFLTLVSQDMPKTSEYVPYIGKFNAKLMYTSFMDNPSNNKIISVFKS